MAIQPVTQPYVQPNFASGATANAANPVAPAGGFQQGGWYNGRQYWDGTFSEPGQINKLSNQQGAGQAVSGEVNAQTSVEAGLPQNANQDYINAQYTTAGTNVGGANAVNPLAATTGGVVSDTQKQFDELTKIIADKKAEADKRRAEVNDNPFLSEASRVGRIAKIDSLLNDSLQTDQAKWNLLQTSLADEKKAAQPDYQITTETDNNGNVTILTIDKKTGKLVSTISGGKIGKADTSLGGSGAKNILSSYILESASNVDQKYQTVNGELKTGDVIDKFGTKTGSYVTGGDKKLSQQEYNLAFDDAYTKALANKSFNGTKAEFSTLFDQTLKDNGYTAWE